jgi:hypothetical protein
MQMPSCFAQSANKLEILALKIQSEETRDRESAGAGPLRVPVLRSAPRERGPT